MDTRGVQNAQMQGPHSTPQDTDACWWATYAEGGDGKNGISRF